MSEIRRAVVKSYDSATHKADVQIAGSLAVWLDAVRVATNIPAADVVTGRQCTVLFLDPSNQDDAVIITIQGANPSQPSGATVAASATVVTETAFGQSAAAGSASPYSRGDHTHGTPTDPLIAHVADADPHTVYGALAQAETWAALQTFNAGIVVLGTLTIGANGGTPRIDITDSKIDFRHKAFPPSAESIAFDGVDLITLVALGVGLPVGLRNDLKLVTAGAAIQDKNANDRIVMADDGINTINFPDASPLATGNGKVLWNFGSATPVNVTAGLGFTVVSNTPSPAADVQGGGFNIGWSGTGTAPKVLGGELLGYLAGGGTITELIGAQSRVQSTVAGSGTITEAISHKIAAPTYDGSKPTTHRGLLVENQGLAGITTSHGIIVEDQSGSTTNIALALGTGHVGFHATTPITRPAAYTQTYATADRTLGAYTPDDESGAYTAASGGDPKAKLDDLNALRVAYENLRAFTEDAVQLLNSAIDDLQSYGLLQ